MHAGLCGALIRQQLEHVEGSSLRRGATATGSGPPVHARLSKAAPWKHRHIELTRRRLKRGS